jgi:hypothetical protein
MHSLRRAVCALLAGVVLLAACGKSEPPPPPPKAEPPKPAAPTVNAELKRLAAEVYVFAFPLVLTDVTRAVETAGLPPETFRHTRTLPDAKTPGASPNADFLYSQAWLDLSDGPMILSVPDTKGRYYLIAILDAWTNVAGSLGKRTTGTEKGEFAIVGPTWKGTLPGGVSEVRSPTNLTWLFARVQTSGGADLDAAARVQNDLKLRQLKAAAKPSAKSSAPRAAPAPAGEAAADTKTAPRDQVAAMDAATFYTRAAMLLAQNPPAADDAPMREKMTKLGITPGKPFDMTKLDALSAQSIQEGAKSAIEAIATSAKSGSRGEIRNGWTFDAALGRWGTDYGKRAVAAYTGLGQNAPEDAIFMATDVDAEGHKLEGANRYVMHFDSKTLPPADGFWSLSVYDDQRHFTPNPQNRYQLGSTSHLAANADGSIDILIQSAAPGTDKSANWLPAPSGRFNVILRLYWPKAEVVERRWVPPGIRKEKAG